MSELRWVAVPGGRTPTGDAVLRVLVIPVLDGDRTLAEQGMAQWPDPGLLSADARLHVVVAEDPSATPREPLSLRPVVEAQEGLWQRFFGAITVRPRGSAPGREVEVEPTTEQADAIMGTYRDVARELTGEDDRDAFDRMARRRGSALAGLAPIPAPAAGAGTPASLPVDFHLATSLLREHPAVLRALGLILQVTVPTSDLQQLPPRGVVQVSWPDAPAALPATGSPWSAFLRDRFLPRPGDGSDVHAAGGMVELARSAGEAPTWRLHTLDIDHALRGLAAAVQPDAGDQAGPLPALRTAGVLLARVGRGGELTGRVGRSAGEVLTAEQLMLGYRVDARVLGQTWLSLCRRESRYAVDGVEFARDLAEEGHVKIGGGIDRGDKVVRTDEVVVRWDGWSLAVPRPTLRDPTPPAAPEVPLPFVLDTSGIRVAPGSLPRLRFGQTYQLCARVADVTGGGPELSEASLDGCDSEPIRFTRHEPVLPPDLRLPAGAGGFGPGAALTSLVVRAADGLPDSAADTVRELVAPAATFEVIERHGRLDGGPDRTRALLMRRDLPDPAAGGVVGFVRGDPGEPPRDLESQEWRSGAGLPAGSDPWPDLRTKRVVLRARQGDEPTLDWEDDDLVVRLSPAQEAVVEISSLIDDDARAAFSISDWLKDGGDGTPGATSAAEDMLATGRHPMATPARRLRVRHAVRAPRGTPQGRLAVGRQEGQTWGLLGVPQEGGDPLVGVHPPTTLAVEVAASWQAVQDAADPPATDRPVGRIDVARTAQRLGTLRHEFGDTKHRMVTYRLTALSRFRDCFDEADESLFRTVGTIGPVSVPSAARPVAPVVRSVTPAFVWQEDRAPDRVVRRRLGHRLRVELAPPWYTTGDGELLAVLSADEGAPAEVADLVTQAGRDPMWQTLDPARFPTPVGDTRSAVLSEGPQVSLTPYGVFEAAGSVFADVPFPDLGSYSPLVQLAVARYQPESVAGLWVSPVVRTDFVPLLPDRTLTVGLGPGTVTVQLDGLAPSGPRLTRVDALLERRVALSEVGEGTATLDGDSAWQVVATAIGRVGEALELLDPGGVTRVRVREVESIGRDTNPVLGTFDELDERVVFSDVVALQA